MVLAASGVCSQIQTRAPPSVKKGIPVGLGLFQALVGFESVGVIVRGDPTLLSFGQLNATSILTFVGLIAIGVMLCFEIKAAMLIGIAGITAVAWTAGLAPLPDAVFSAPSLSVRYPTFYLFFFNIFF